MKKFIFIMVVCISVCLFLFYKASKDTYMKERVYSCKVLSKIDNQYITSVKGVSHHNRDFILVLETEHKRFSLDIDPTTWAICKEGDTLHFTIAPYEIDYYGSIPIRYGFWAMVMVMATLIIIIVYLFIKWSD